MRNITPQHLRCPAGYCESIQKRDDGSLLIVGRIAEPHEMAGGDDVNIGDNEAAVIISPDLLADVEREWRTIDQADKDRDILALSSGYCDGKRPLMLKWFKYNGLAAWRDWDAEPHQPHLFVYPPSPPKPLNEREQG